ncbi:MAG: hypothetical protein V4733_12900 [Verrucomicrobiota bacterium]
MPTIINRMLSLIVFAAYVIGCYHFTGSPERTFRFGIGLIFPLACIWFGQFLGQYTGSVRGHPITSRSPGWLVCFLGWFILVGLPVLMFFLSIGLEPTSSADH